MSLFPRNRFLLLSHFLALSTYYLVFGRRHHNKRKLLSKELQLAYEMVEELEEKVGDHLLSVYLSLGNIYIWCGLYCSWGYTYGSMWCVDRIGMCGVVN